MSRQLGFLALLATAAMFASQGVAAVILSDSFNRGPLGSGDGNGNPAGVTPKSDWGANDNALGGSAVQTYAFDQSRGGGAQQTTNGSVAQLYAGAAQMELNLGPLAPLGYTVAFDFTRTAGNGFVTLGIGLNDTNQIENTGGFNGNAFLFTNPANGADGAVLFKQNGDLELWNGAAAPGSAVPGFYAMPEATNSALITVSAPNGYGAGQTGTLTAQIGAATASVGLTFDGISSGYLSFYSNQLGATIDNLVVAAIPEPATIALSSLGGLAMVAVRRRRR